MYIICCIRTLKKDTKLLPTIINLNIIKQTELNRNTELLTLYLNIKKQTQLKNGTNRIKQEH
jgi:hypothetical protein